MSETGNSVALENLLTLMANLRDPKHGCPWDRQQDFVSIAPHTLEEVYEVIDAIERKDPARLVDELGDLLFQIVFFAQLGREAGLFDFDTIAESITRKLLRRHPHVFPEATLESFGKPTDITAEGVAANWEAIKSAERSKGHADQGISVLEDVPLALPAILRAAKLQKRAATVHFDWLEASSVIDKLEEELAELKAAFSRQRQDHIAEEFGDLMFTMVNLGRHLKVEPEQCLRAANDKFERRFRHLELLIKSDGLSPGTLDLDQLEQYWQRVKRLENHSP